MTSAEPRWRRRPESRRDELLDAAQRLFADKGVESTTVSDIVAAAGLAKGSFYRYFTSKEDLFTALKDRLFHRMDDQLDAAVADALGLPGDAGESPPDPDGVLSMVIGGGRERFAEMCDAGVTAAVEFLYAESELIAVWARQREGTTEAQFSRGVERLVCVFQWTVAEGMRHGLVDCVDPERTIRLIVHAIEGMTVTAILTHRECEAEPIAAAARALVRRALGLPDA